MPDVRANVSKGIYAGDADHSRYFKDLWNQYAVYLWLLGIIIVLVINLGGYARYSMYLRRTNKPAADEQKKVLAVLLDGRKYVRLVCSRFVNTPMLTGILTPTIILPVCDFEGEQLKNILLHEISHLRRFDIAIKWLVMIASAIHWFNPLMYMIKKEMNHACELACDEAVIKNLTPAEKQAYGNTLISMAAENKYPYGVVQATMCEEKKSLMERLTAIMNHHKKSGFVIILSGILMVAAVTGAVTLGASVGTVNDKPPNIYIGAEGVETKAALLGSYSWKYRGRSIQSDSDPLVDLPYKAGNTVNIAAKQQIVIGTQKIRLDKKYDFTIDEISVYKEGRKVTFESVKPSFMNGNLYLQTPPDAGEYTYGLNLNFKNKGTVSYGFVVRVDMLTYDLAGISKYKTPYIGDHSKVSAIAGRLPVPDSYFRHQYISMETSSRPYTLTVFYEADKGASHSREWPIANPDSATYLGFRKNALVLFCMIDNLDGVTFAFRDSQSDGKLEPSKYSESFTFSRASIEAEYGDPSALGKDLGLLQNVLSGTAAPP